MSIRSSVLAMCSLALGMLAVSGSASANPLPSATSLVGKFLVIASHSNKCLDVAWFNQAEDADVVQADCSFMENQVWEVFQRPHGVQIIARHSGQALAVVGASLAHGSKVVQRPRPTGGEDASQVWDLLPYSCTFSNIGICEYAIVNRNSHMCLDVAWSAQETGAQIVQATCTFTRNQRWIFDKDSLLIN